MKPLSEPTVVFHCLPGTAQSALTRLIYQCFVVVHDEPEGLGPSPQSKEELIPVDTTTLSSSKLFLFRGHMSPMKFILKEVYPEVLADPRFFCFTFLSDPLRVAAAIYQHLVSRPTEGSRWDSFEHFISVRPANTISSVFRSRWWNYRRTLEQYDFVGVCEKIEESVAALVPLIDAKYAQHADNSANARRVRFFLEKFRTQPVAADPQPEVDAHLAALGSDAISRFRARNSADYRLYDHALSLLEKSRRQEKVQ